MNKKDKLTECFIYVLFVTVIAFCMYCTPLTHDDLGFAKNELSFKSVIEIGNGRYLGNWLAICLSQYGVVRVIVKTVCIVGIVAAIQYLLELDGVLSLLLCALLILCPGRNICAETYTWTVGFSIYVPGVFIMLLAFVFAKLSRRLTNKYIRCLVCILILLFSSMAQLFVEHATLLNLCSTFFLFLLAILKKGQLQEKGCLFIGTVIGAVGIFVLRYIGGVSQDMKEYRGVFLSLSSIRNNVIQFLTIARFMSACTILLVTFSVFLLCKLYCENKICDYKYINLVLFIMPAYSLLMGNMTNWDSWAIEHATVLHFTYVVLFVWYVLVVAFWLIKLEFDNKYSMLISYGAGIFIIFVLCVVSPIGGRTLFMVYICWTITVLMMFKEIVFNDFNYKAFRLGLGIFFVMTCYSMILSFQSIHTISLAREQYLAECLENGEREIFVPTANVDGYIYNDDIDIEEGVQVHMIDWANWKDLRQQ